MLSGARAQLEEPAFCNFHRRLDMMQDDESKKMMIAWYWNMIEECKSEDGADQIPEKLKELFFNAQLASGGPPGAPAAGCSLRSNALASTTSSFLWNTDTSSFLWNTDARALDQLLFDLAMGRNSHPWQGPGPRRHVAPPSDKTPWALLRPLNLFTFSVPTPLPISPSFHFLPTPPPPKSLVSIDDSKITFEKNMAAIPGTGLAPPSDGNKWIAIETKHEIDVTVPENSGYAPALLVHDDGDMAKGQYILRLFAREQGFALGPILETDRLQLLRKHVIIGRPRVPHAQAKAAGA
ncbi:hypothetical protein QBC39DRAFT_374260 [Podospora conica]|nr:hypothetical protein QBC39DRAFT_374260 [Schizothecium conicum]